LRGGPFVQDREHGPPAGQVLVDLPRVEKRVRASAVPQERERAGAPHRHERGDVRLRRYELQRLAQAVALALARTDLLVPSREPHAQVFARRGIALEKKSRRLEKRPYRGTMRELAGVQ